MLVKSARCCCLCRQFKGTKIEVHHIIPKADGGTDDIDNGIPLCFDCHAEMGYSTDHPSGRRYTPAELKKHRDMWFDLVASDNKFGISTSRELNYAAGKLYDIVNQDVILDTNKHIVMPGILENGWFGLRTANLENFSWITLGLILPNSHPDSLYTWDSNNIDVLQDAIEKHAVMGVPIWTQCWSPLPRKPVNIKARMDQKLFAKIHNQGFLLFQKSVLENSK